MSQGMLSPPILGSTIPAFAGTTLVVPFTMNRAVSWNQVKGFQIKIKSVQSGNVLYSNNIELVTKTDVMKNNSFIVTLPSDQTWLRIGQFYKIQIAYIDTDNVIGYYSSVAVTKYTATPTLTISGLNSAELNSHIYNYTGCYESTDITEKPYYYRFDLYNNDGIIIDSSGLLLHNTEMDNPDQPTQASDLFSFHQDLDTINGPFHVQYTVVTNNGLTVSSPSYRIAQRQSIDPELNAKLQVSLNYENGYVDIRLNAQDSSNDALVTGSFLVSKACEDDNYSEWHEVHRFKLLAQIPTLFLCRDFTVEQGKKYRYSIQQYSDKLVSNRLLSDEIFVDFEDAFLFDGKRQLKIKYNPKVSSFKKDVLETKTDTIGGKHPFIFRNGRVYYNEFSISGLISYQMDEENLFMPEKNYDSSVNLTGENIAAEREFKMKVLEWLTNGEPKIFRSPTEGNYIVRLMNSSLAPNDTVGRMLHTFTSTAYEVADFNYATLGEMGFIAIEESQLNTMIWETVEFYSSITGYKDTNTNLLPDDTSVSTIRFDSMTPGDVVSITFAGENQEAQEIKIGVTGSYYIDIGVEITDVQLKQQSRGSMTYSYNHTKASTFETIYEIQVEERIAEQFIGEKDIIKEILYIQKSDGSWVKNPKLEIANIYNITIEQRPLQRVSSKVGHNDPYYLYEIGTTSLGPGSQPNGRPQEVFNTEYYYDGYNNIEYNNDDKIYKPFVKIDGEIISVKELGYKTYIRPDIMKEFLNGNGSLTTMTYQCLHVVYNIEEQAGHGNLPSTHSLYNLQERMKDYNHALDALQDYKMTLIESSETLDITVATNKMSGYRSAINNAYQNYILALIDALKADEISRRGESEQ